MKEYLNVHCRVSEKWSQMDYHSHQEFEIFFFHSGTCRYVINNQIYDLVPGDILLMDGMALHKPNIPANGEYVRSIVHFSPHWIKGLLKEAGGQYLLDVFENLHHCLLRTNEDEDSKELESVLIKLEAINRLSFSENNMMEIEEKALFLQVLLIVNRLYRKKSVKPSFEKSEKSMYAENIATYIQANYMNKLTLDSIASELNLSKYYICRVFKEITGFTVMEFVMGYRLTQVKYLLEMEPEKPLKEIAYDCGFESISHFSRYFKEKVGVTAKEFRRDRLLIYSEENGK